MKRYIFFLGLLIYTSISFAQTDQDTSTLDKSGKVINLGVVPRIYGDPDSDDVEKAMYNYMGQQDNITHIITPTTKEDFIAKLKKFEKHGYKVKSMIIAGHGTGDFPYIQFADGRLESGQLDRKDLTNKSAKYSNYIKKYENLLRNDSLNSNLKKKLASANKKSKEIEKELDFINSIPPIMDTNGGIVLINCSTVATAKGEKFVKNLGAALFGEKVNGGILASRSDVTIDQTESILATLITPGGLWNKDVGDYFIDGDWMIIPVNGGFKKTSEIKDKANLEISLELLQEQIDKLKALKNQTLKKGRKNLENTRANLSKVKSIFKEDKDNRIILEKNKGIISVFDNKGSKICSEAEKLQAKIRDLSKALNDGEVIINNRINRAKERAANCRTAEDNIFVKTSYQDAKEVFAVSKRAKDGAYNYFLHIENHFKQIEKLNTSLDSVYSILKNKFKPKNFIDDIKRDNINHLLSPIPLQIEELELGIVASKEFPLELQKLKKNIESSKASYDLKAFPKYEAKFNKLIKEVESISTFDYVVDLAILSDLHDEYTKYKQAILLLSGERENTEKINRHTISCFPIETAKNEIDNIEEVFFRELLVIKDNEHLSDGCVPRSRDEADEDTTVNTDNADVDFPPPTTTTDTTSINTPPTPEKNTFGGLIIGGPSTITVGKAVRFRALDGGRDPYPSAGSFEWVNAREDLMVLSKSGQSSRALALKPGSATMLLKYDGMTAWKDITIVENESNEEDDEMEAIGEEDIADQLHKQKCEEFKDRIAIFLNSKNVEAARRTANKATAFGCNVNTGAIKTAIAEIEEEKRLEQEEWERQYALQEEERRLEAERLEAERRKRRNENLNAFLGLIGEKLNEINNDGDNPTVKPEHKRTGECSQKYGSGATAPEEYTIDVYDTRGRVTFEYETFEMKDRIQVYYGGRKIFDSGCVGTEGWLTKTFTLNGFSSVFRIVINPLCDPKESTTRWEFKLGCPE